MLTRPLAPFRSRPVRRNDVRKTAEADVIAKLAEETSSGIKAMRSAPRVAGPSAERLRVLKPSSDQE